MQHDHARLAWLRLNAYGVLLAGLAVLGLADLANPGGTDLARMVGEIPPGQTFWVLGFVVSGLLLMLGFVRADRVAESAGLVMLIIALVAQTVVAFALLGWTGYTTTRLIILGLLGLCVWARLSVLWTREGLTITIPPRNGQENGQ